MAPTPAATAAPSYTYATVAPMTTIWTPPASCISPTPNVLGGSCSSFGCVAYSPSDIIKNWDAWINGGYWTTSHLQVSTDCAPPSTQRVIGFSYSPARGCPSGYMTAAASTSYYNLDVSVICCPSNYPELQTLNNGGYECWRYMTAPETMSVLAVGNLYETDSEGYTTETYWSVSPISTTVISPTANAKTLWVYADAIQMVVPSSWATATSTIATTTNTPTSTGWDSSLPNFHIGPLNFIYSIVVTVAGGIFILIVLCCCYACCRRRPRPRPIGPLQSSFEYRSPERQPISTFQPTSGYGGSTAQPTATLSPEPSARPFCSYGLADDCRSTLKGTCCCACADKRPSPMTREDRIVTYCLFCRLFWAGVPVSLCPKEWELLGPKCAHKDNASCEKDDSSSCCACCDKRKKFLDLDFRVKDYCPPCRRFWEVKRPVEWPAVWARPPVQPVQPTPRPTPAPQPTPPPDRRKAKNKDKSKDIELLTISEKSAAKGPEMEICEADDEKGKNLEDKGPQYDEPQFFDERNPNPRPAASEDGGEILQTIKSISMGDGAVPPEQFGIDDRGPTYAPTPHLQVAADQPSTTGITTGMTSQPNGAPASSLLSPLPASAESSRSSTPLSKTDRQREKERRGLRYQAPKFSVLPGGELAEGSNET